MQRLPTLDEVVVTSKRVLLRADLNVPLADGGVADDYRIRATLPTINRLRADGAITIVCSHLGRPKGPDPRLRMNPVAHSLSELAGFPVRKLDRVVGPEVEAEVMKATAGEVLLLENTRFEPGETVNDSALSQALARLGELFVLDAFGSAHRAHSSTVGVASHLRSAAGPLLLAEVEAFERLLTNPPRPFVVLLGGAKVSGKLGLVRNLLPNVDAMLIGGGMCFTLLAAEGYDVGASLLEHEMIASSRQILDSAHGIRMNLPIDLVVGEEFVENTAAQVAPVERMPAGGVALDIGPETIERFVAAVSGSGSVYWNGPMGVFEWEAFRAGTKAVAEAIGAHDGFSVVGGGDTVAALRMFGVDERVSHMSTGGGAGLELLEGRTLPGIEALEKWADGQ
ncbi:MAG: phosphoglycerate kinase [Acidimicrobiia bacterium]